MIMPRFLDVEASSLSIDSYPIEIAWSDHQGNIERRLINPYAVDGWRDWDYNAQQMHGLSRKQCREEGIHPKQMCNLMSQSIKPGEISMRMAGHLMRTGLMFFIQKDQHWVMPNSKLSTQMPLCFHF